MKDFSAIPPSLIAAAIAALIGCFLVWLMTRIRYRITPVAVEVVLFGVCLRRVPFDDIRGITKHPKGLCEKWPNAIRIYKRTLYLERRSGRFRNFLITPEHRYVFRAKLVEAMRKGRQMNRRRGGSEAEEPAVVEDDDE